jgi:thioredoxin reductase (NADPH)
VVVASGARYRRLAGLGAEPFEGSSIHYWASPVEARICAGQEVALVGGGNSAGQAVVYLAGRTQKVWVIVRGASLEQSMSRYLIERIGAQPNIELLCRTQVERLDVDASGALSAVAWRCETTGEVQERAIRHLFLFVGADPCADWLSGCNPAIDDKGFLLTGKDARPGEDSPPNHMTNLDGVFAIGDVRSGSVKRVAAAVGEGAAVVAQIHAYLTERRPGELHSSARSPLSA